MPYHAQMQSKYCRRNQQQIQAKPSSTTHVVGKAAHEKPIADHAIMYTDPASPVWKMHCTQRDLRRSSEYIRPRNLPQDTYLNDDTRSVEK